MKAAIDWSMLTTNKGAMLLIGASMVLMLIIGLWLSRPPAR